MAILGVYWYELELCCRKCPGPIQGPLTVCQRYRLPSFMLEAQFIFGCPDLWPLAACLLWFLSVFKPLIGGLWVTHHSRHSGFYGPK